MRSLYAATRWTATNAAYSEINVAAPGRRTPPGRASNSRLTAVIATGHATSNLPNAEIRLTPMNNAGMHDDGHSSVLSVARHLADAHAVSCSVDDEAPTTLPGTPG